MMKFNSLAAMLGLSVALVQTDKALALSFASQRPLANGYALVYSDHTQPGMSGGLVLNQNGEVVGVHGEAETRLSDSPSAQSSESASQVKSTGFNLGILSNTYLGLSPLNVGVRPPSPKVATAATADDFFLQGVNDYQKGNYRSASADYTQAIRLNPKDADAYYNRGLTRYELGDKQGASADYTQAIRLNPNYAKAYNNRGAARYQLGDKPGAVEDFTQAIRLNPKDADAYYNRGLTRYELGDKQGALADLQQAAKLAQQQGNTDLYQKIQEQIKANSLPLSRP